MKKNIENSISQYSFWLLVGCVCLCFLSVGLGGSALPRPAGEGNAHRIYSGTFFSAEGGAGLIDWKNFALTPFVSFRSNARSGTAFGFATGYRFYKFFALQGGIIILPTVKGLGFSNSQLPPRINSIGVASHAGYLITKFYIRPYFLKYFYFILGAGVTYRSVRPKPVRLFTNNDAYYYAPIANLGAEFDVSQDWFCFVNYYYIPKYNRNLDLQSTKFFNTPEANIVLAGIGYKLSV